MRIVARDQRVATVDSLTPGPVEFRDYAAGEAAALVSRLRSEYAEDLNRHLLAVRNALDATAATVETVIASRAPGATTDEISEFVERLTAAAVARADASVQRVRDEERALTEALRRELQAEKDRADAARAGRKQSELASMSH